MTDLIHTAQPADTDTAPAVRSLESLLDDTAAAYLPVRLTYSCVDAVVLERRDRSVDVVLDTGFVRTVALDDSAELIVDPIRQVELLRRAARTLAAQCAQARQELQHDADRHRRVLREIRAYAIEKRRSNEICQDGLDQFLHEFNMAPDQVLVRFTITGSYRVEQSDCDTAESDASDHLDVDFGQVDGVVHDTADFDVRIDSAEAVNDND
ncbi:MAG TPA: hypothetical protein VK453_11845 [Micromonosporaceae bacterium]|nr:hypothetical protein [Micromonosporaceae bacterium]